MDDRPAQILIVDDEEELRNLLKEHLEDHGYTCFTAPNGQVGLDVLAQEMVDLAVVDIMMPGMTGLSFFQRMKETHPDVAVIFVTAVDDLSLAVEHLKTGASDYLVKPVPLKRFKRAVQQALARRATQLAELHQRMTLEEQVVRQAEGLEARSREVGALNRLLQASLTEDPGPPNEVVNPR